MRGARRSHGTPLHLPTFPPLSPPERSLHHWALRQRGHVAPSARQQPERGSRVSGTAARVGVAPAPDGTACPAPTPTSSGHGSLSPALLPSPHVSQFQGLPRRRGTWCRSADVRPELRGVGPQRRRGMAHGSHLCADEGCKIVSASCRPLQQRAPVMRQTVHQRLQRRVWLRAV